MSKTIKVAIAVLVLIVLPIVPTNSPVTAPQPILEQYTIIVPYTSYDEVQVPYKAIESRVYWQESEAYSDWKRRVKTSIEDSLPPTSLSGRWITEQYFVTRYRAASQEVTKYHEAVKYRTVYTPVEKTQTKLVSVLQYIIGR